MTIKKIEGHTLRKYPTNTNVQNNFLLSIINTQIYPRENKENIIYPIVTKSRGTPPIRILLSVLHFLASLVKENPGKGRHKDTFHFVSFTFHPLSSGFPDPMAAERFPKGGQIFGDIRVTFMKNSGSRLKKKPSVKYIIQTTFKR